MNNQDRGKPLDPKKSIAGHYDSVKLRPCDLTDRGMKRAEFTIEAMTKMATYFPRDKETRDVVWIWFKGQEKGLKLTATDRKVLENTFGPTPADCVGKKVELHIETGYWFGENHTVLRISSKEYLNKQAAAKRTASKKTNDELNDDLFG